MKVNNLPLISADDEWSPLRAVIVGRAEHSAFPSEPKAMIRATMPDEHFDKFRSDQPFPEDILLKAQQELDNFASILEREGIKVYRPKEVNWLEAGGYTGAMPRDGLTVVGNTMIEAPFTWKCRANEIKLAYEDILQELSLSGSSRICRAPQINGKDTIYDGDHDSLSSDTVNPRQSRWAINNSRPAFDAADFMRFGSTVIVQLSHVTNRKGVDYFQALLPTGYHVEILETTDEHAMHIDATILPLRKGILIYHPQRITAEALRKHKVFHDWELHAYPFQPHDRNEDDPPLFMTSGWLVLNALSLDEKRIMVEAKDTVFAKWVEDKFGMVPIMCPFQHVNSIGGSFHCATVDLVRTG